MFATRDIQAGELIAIEHPALILPAASLPEEAYNEIGLQLPDRRRALWRGIPSPQSLQSQVSLFIIFSIITLI
jgi:hypothetical protein